MKDKSRRDFISHTVPKHVSFSIPVVNVSFVLFLLVRRRTKSVRFRTLLYNLLRFGLS